MQAKTFHALDSVLLCPARAAPMQSFEVMMISAGFSVCDEM
jgi:hypothetical protein